MTNSPTESLVARLREEAAWSAADADLSGLMTEAAERLSTLEAALTKIERWFGEFPETDRYWYEDKPHTPDNMMSYAAVYGSNGERDFMRAIARTALSNEAGK